MMPLRLRLLVAALPLAVACGATPTEIIAARPDDPASTFASQALAFVDVAVLTMTSPTLLQHQTVVVRDGKIASVGPMSQEQALGGATIVAGHGRVLMPALADMHVHMYDSNAARYPQYGIGTVRNMWGHSVIRAIRDSIAAGSRFGPQVITASPGLDAPPGVWPVTQFVSTGEEARTVIAALKALNYPYLKVYSSLSAAMFDTVMKLSRENGIPAFGHVPQSVTVQHALAEKMLSIEHFTGYDRAVSRTGNPGYGFENADETRFASLVQQTVAAGTWNCPTLAVYVMLVNRNAPALAATVIASRQRLVKALHDGGAKLLVGTDAGFDTMVAGASLYDELDQFVAAGLTPYEVLRLATVKAAEFFGRTDFGVVAPGARADLLLIGANPLSDIRRVRAIGGVVMAGAWTPQRELATRTSGWKQ